MHVLKFHIVGHLVFPPPFWEVLPGIFCPTKNNYVISLIPYYYAQAYLSRKKSVRFFFFFLVAAEAEREESDSALPPLQRGVLHLDELWEERAQAGCHVSCLLWGPPLGSRCFLPQVEASEFLLLRRRGCVLSSLLPAAEQANTSSLKAPEWRR